MTEETQETLKGVSHTNPFTENAFGDAMAYHRGPVLAADGGDSRDATTDANEPDQRGRRLADVDHTPPYGEGVNRVYERGTEGRDEGV